jgi:predicted ATPase/DNA-binding SARP family transcriptional activator
MDYRVLGSLEVRDGDGLLELGAAKQRALLAVLLLNVNQTVSRDRLIDELWGDNAPETAVQSIHVYVSRLRKVLPPQTLLTRPPGYALKIERDELDLHRFEQMVVDGRISLAAGDPDRGSRVLRDALALWRGPAFAEFAEEPFARTEIARIDELRLAALEDRIEADLALGRQATVIGELEALVTENPHREHLREQLMLALYRSGRQPEALAAYHDAREKLAELGLGPGERLRELERKILNHDPSLEPPSRRSVGATPTNLPAQPTSFVGRERELAEIVATVASDRASVLTLTGAAGSGKTRLAVAAAWRVADHFPHGVIFISLEHVRDAALVAPAIARALDLHSPPDELEDAIERRLRGRRVLLVLDNFEHVLAAAPAVARLVTATSVFLVTSRAPLYIAAEREYPVPTMAPHEARELFVERARALAPNFESSRTAAAICQRLDNLPLAIELAAARVDVLAPEAILRRLNSMLSLLTTGPRDAPTRQQTLRAALDWSYDLLPDLAKTLLSRLAVFVGEFSLAAAERVCDADLETVQVLVDNSLVRTHDGRLSLLDAVSEYASERLSGGGEAEAVRLRHARYFAELGDQMFQSGRRGDDDGGWASWAIANSGNLEAARSVLKATHSRLDELRLIAPLASAQAYTERRHEALGTLEEVLEGVDLSDHRRCEIEFLAAWLAGKCGRHTRGRELAAASVVRARGVGDTLTEVGALAATAFIVSEQGDLEFADDAHLQAERVARDHWPSHVPFILANRALIALERAEFARARTLFDEALLLTGGTGDGLWINLALSYLLEDRPTEAEPWLRRSLSKLYDIGSKAELLYALNGYVAFHATDRPERAARLLGALESLRAELGISLERVDLLLATQTREKLASRLGCRFDELEADGAEMELDDAIALALAS